MKTIGIVAIIIILSALLVGCILEIKSIFDGDWGIRPVNGGSEPSPDVIVQHEDTQEGLAIENTYDEVIKTNLMLNWVINCESSGRHEDIWGQAGEYGILQFKEKSFYWLSEKYNFTGDWKNQDDQIELFLLTSEADKEIHWSCYRKYLNYKNNN